MVMERLFKIEVGAAGTATEEIEMIYTMTGFRRRFLGHHLCRGSSARWRQRPVSKARGVRRR
jgi:hypothetical protein